MDIEKYIIFSYYFINENKEIDKIIKDKFVLSTPVLNKKDLFKNVIKYKNSYHSPVQLHEILLFTCDDEKDINLNNFMKLNHAHDIYLQPKPTPLQLLTRIYVFFKVKTTTIKSLKIKKSNRSSRKNTAF